MLEYLLDSFLTILSLSKWDVKLNAILTDDESVNELIVYDQKTWMVSIFDEFLIYMNW